MSDDSFGYLDFNIARRLQESPLPFAVFAPAVPEDWQTRVPPGTRFCELPWRSPEAAPAVMEWLRSLPEHSKTLVLGTERSEIAEPLMELIVASGEYETMLHRYGDAWQATTLVRGASERKATSIRRWVRRGLIWFFGRQLPDRPMGEFALDQGFSYRAYSPSLTRGSELGSAPPRLLLFEDDRLLPPYQAPHNVIRAHGRGRYSKWFPDIFFSSSDSSDPRSNGRVYRAVRLNPLLVAAFLALQAPTSRWFRRRFEGDAAFLEGWREAIEQDNRALASAPPAQFAEPKRVAILLGALAAGGAERQVANLALGLAKRGTRVDVLALNPLVTDSDRHYAIFLQHPLIRVIDATVPNPEFRCAEGFARLKGVKLDLVDSLPNHARDGVWSLLTHLIAEPPEVMHCFLDRPNLIGGLVGWLIDVPRILLSTRSLNPSNFPTFNQAWFRDYYLALHGSRRVRLCGNSMAGIRDYAKWMKVPAEDFLLTRNGLDPAFLGTGAAWAQTNQAPLPQAPTIAGLFRLAPEKRPETFLRVVRRVRSSVPGLKVRIAGDGPLEGEMRGLIRKWGLGSCVELLGRTREVRSVIESASMVLLTSAFEGTPNVLLEAQYLGRPVVTTRAGGAAETLDEGHSGYSCAIDDVSALAERCVRILQDAQAAQRMGQAGHVFVATHFSLEAMVRDVQSAYLNGWNR